jgi:acetyl esterase
MTGEVAQSDVAAPLEAGVRAFVDDVMRESRRLAGDAAPSLERTREIAAEVRRPWRAGGPRMQRVFERHAATGPGVDLRVYMLSNAIENGGALVYLHGGGWTLFSVETHDRLMREYAERSGLTVLGVEYALSPEAKFPTALNQVVAAVNWLRIDTTLGLDPTRIVLGGDSAGANLALAAALALREAGVTPRGLLLSYGCFRVESSAEAVALYGGADAMLSGAEMAAFWRNYLRGPADADDPLACPLKADLRGLPPTFVAVAECDVLAEQSRELSAKLHAAGVEATTASYAGAAHSFLEAVSVSPLAARALQEAADWLRRICG